MRSGTIRPYAVTPARSPASGSASAEPRDVAAAGREPRDAADEPVDALVIGSGFGGAVAAARLAQAGLSVTVLERGRRWLPGTFPREPQLDRDWLWHADQGLFDIRWFDRMGSITAAGWGGGSLVYANVFARPFGDAMDATWPEHLRRERLDPYYDLAAHMLGVSPVGADPRTGALPARTQLTEGLTADLRIREGSVRPNLAVTFGAPDVWTPNAHGIPRRGCAFVGECVIGCNHGAKNTLDHTYLAVAERAGARAVTDAQVERIIPTGDGYVVTTTRPSAPEAPAREWRARRVVLAAGAVATTELLLRARDVHGDLPLLSRHLGRGFSGNGDFLTMAQLRGRGGGDLTSGPTITTTTVLDVPEGRGTVWFQAQDGAIPPPLLDLLDSVLPASAARHWWRRHVRRTDPRRQFAVLAMGRDSGNGILRLDRHGRATLSWRNAWQSRLYRSQRRLAPLLADLLGARLTHPITWSLMRSTVTVHPLGGVRPGVDAGAGVVDEVGEVHGHPGLFVLDGSTLPAAIGVNPSATILAAAERSIEQVIRRADRPDWRAPEWSAVSPAPVPEDAAFAAMARLRLATRGDGVVFSERMTDRSVLGQASVDLRLGAEILSTDLFLDDPEHAIPVAGTLTVPGLVRDAAVKGRLSLFPEGRAEAMSYRLTFTAADGRPWQLTGRKSVASRTPAGLVTGLTTLPVEISPVEISPAEGSRHAPIRTTLTIGPADLAALTRSLTGVGFTRGRRLRALARFVGFFAGSAVAPRRDQARDTERDPVKVGALR